MATDHEESLQQRYLREHNEYVARIESMTTGHIMALDVQLADVTAQRDQLLAALEAVLPWVVTQEVACNGLKCREPVCMSCFDDSEQSAESAADAYRLAEQTIASVKGD